MRHGTTLALTISTKAKAALHTKRFEARRTVLERVFTPTTFQKVWKRYVRPGLRAQEIVDLHDYNDVHWMQADIFEALRTTVLSGQYVANRSIPVQVEKRHGVNRTLVIPSAADAVILQCLVEHILPKAQERQPSKNAFFSRSHSSAIPEFKFEKDYVWFSRWVEFSKLRFELADQHRFILTTDIANYYDNIDYTHLRHLLSELDGVEEVVMDLVFGVIDTISWRPDYLPSPHRSLPQVDFDAPRLLSHVYLFEVDSFLRKRTGNRFLRWVDDITAAAASRTDAKLVLRDLDQMLMTRGLRLNAGKTHVLSAKEAHKFFWSRTNKVLDAETDKLKRFAHQPKRLSILCARVEKAFDVHLKADRYGHWVKVTKRYMGLLTRLRSPHAIEFAATALIDLPEMRDAIWRYFQALGPSTRIAKILTDYVMSDHALDDSSIFKVAKTIVEWEVKPGSNLHKRLRKLGSDIYLKPHDGRLDFRFLASLWILGKYGQAPEVLKLLHDHRNVWVSSDFLSRQVAALLPKFRQSNHAKSLRRDIERHQIEGATSVLLSLDSIVANQNGCTQAVRLYILNGMHKSSYSLQRFLICLHVLNSKSISLAFRMKLKADVLKYVNDPLYRRVITAIKT